MIHDVLVVGNGIIGQIAIDELSKKGYKIAILDRVNEDSKIAFHRDIEGNQSVWIKGSRIAGYPGGRSNWGRNCSLVTIENYLPFGNDFQQRLPNFAKHLRKHGFPKLTPIQLTISKPDRFFVRESKNFSSAKWISKIRSRQNCKIIDGTATKLVAKSHELVQVIYRDFENYERNVFARKVLICAGPFGTQELLAKSGILKNCPEYIWDHISLEVGKFKLKVPSLAKFGLFGWNRIPRLNLKTCFTKFDKEQNILWTLRIFPSQVLALKEIKKIIKSLLKNNEFFYLFRMTLKIIVSLISGKILHSEILVHLTADFLEKNQAIKSASYGNISRIDFMAYENLPNILPQELLDFMMEKLYCFKFKFEQQPKFNPEIELSNIYTSSHHMGTLHRTQGKSNPRTSEIVDNIFVAGSSLFDWSVPGHPTMLAGATALLAVSEIHSQLS